MFMFKPAKLSSVLTESQTTPVKGDRQLLIDITMDLSNRSLKEIPIIGTFINGETAPTIIDLRNNLIEQLPSSLFQITSLRQLRLDGNKVSVLPSMIG